VVLLLWVARRRFGGLGGRALLESLARTLLASTPLAAWCALCLWVWPRGGSGWLDAAWLALGVGMGAVIFLGTSRVLATPEYRALRGTLPFRGPR
jgi:hypothetical protein